MNRVLMIFSLALLPSIAPADEAQESDCLALGQIAQRAADMRVEGKRARRTQRTIARDQTGENARFAPAVPLLVEWVYSLPEEQLTAEVGTAYADACRAQLQ